MSLVEGCVRNTPKNCHDINTPYAAGRYGFLQPGRMKMDFFEQMEELNHPRYGFYDFTSNERIALRPGDWVDYYQTEFSCLNPRDPYVIHVTPKGTPSTTVGGSIQLSAHRVEDDEWRLPRLNSLVHVLEMHELDGDPEVLWNIHSMHDHKGYLTVTYKFPPTRDHLRAVFFAWNEFDEEHVKGRFYPDRNPMGTSSYFEVDFCLEVAYSKWSFFEFSPSDGRHHKLEVGSEFEINQVPFMDYDADDIEPYLYELLSHGQKVST